MITKTFKEYRMNSVKYEIFSKAVGELGIQIEATEKELRINFKRKHFKVIEDETLFNIAPLTDFSGFQVWGGFLEYVITIQDIAHQYGYFGNRILMNNILKS